MTRTVTPRRDSPSPQRSASEPRSRVPRLHPTKNDLPEANRRDAIALLNQRLADCVDLQLQCKQAHWNVKGPTFIALHELFDEISASIAGYADLIAERAVQLGGIAEGTAVVAAERSALLSYPLAISSGAEHVAALSDALASFGRAVRTGIDAMEELEDADSADIMTEISRGVDKWLWFVEAHQQGAGRGQHDGSEKPSAAGRPT